MEDPGNSDLVSKSANDFGWYEDISQRTDTHVMLLCSKGHVCISPIDKVREVCAICKILNVIERSRVIKLSNTMSFRNNVATCSQSKYDYGQVSFRFICGEGHNYIKAANSPFKACPVCTVQSQVHIMTGGAVIDSNCLYINTKSRLRVLCKHATHNSNCNNAICIGMRTGAIFSNREYDINCTDIISCNREFYVTEEIIRIRAKSACAKSLLSCVGTKMTLSHWSNEQPYSNLICTVEVFETAFNARFDDDEWDNLIIFTGYNKELKIGFTHSADVFASKSIENTAKWCTAHGVRFFHINANVKLASDCKEENITRGICDMLVVQGLIKLDKDELFKNVRWELKQLRRLGKKFQSRMFGAQPVKLLDRWAGDLGASKPSSAVSKTNDN